MRSFGIAVLVLLAVQFVGLCVYSSYLYRRFDLSSDFAIYAQAWSAIGHGNLNPTDSIHIPTFPFWQSHFELAMWPVAFLHVVWPHPVVLLWLQDLAVVCTEAITIYWIACVCIERLERRRVLVAGIATIVSVGSLWWYEVVSFDVHFEVLGLPFLVLVGYSLWRGRGHGRMAVIGALIALLFGDVVSISLLFVSLAGLASGRVRSAGLTKVCLGLLAASVGWLVLIVLLNANQASGVVQNYGYLVHAGPHASAAAVIGGVLAHPLHAARTIVDRWRDIGHLLLAGGVLGLFTPWGFFVALGTVVPTGLNSNTSFLSPIAAFQTAVVIPFVGVGTVMVLTRLQAYKATGGSSASRQNLWPTTMAWLLALVLFVAGFVQGASFYGQIRSDWWKVDASAASRLAEAEGVIPSQSEVIASDGVIGRFDEHRFVFSLVGAPQAFQVRSKIVTFVFAATEGIEPDPASLAEAQLNYVYKQLGARVVLSSDGVSVFEWRPPSGVRTIVLPA